LLKAGTVAVAAVEALGTLATVVVAFTLGAVALRLEVVFHSPLLQVELVWLVRLDTPAGYGAITEVLVTMG
jgi:hypothetical protein